VRRRFAPHQLRHAHAVEMSREGVPLLVIQGSRLMPGCRIPLFPLVRLLELSGRPVGQSDRAERRAAPLPLARGLSRLARSGPQSLCGPHRTNEVGDASCRCG
jgi:hypothetical protein